MAIASETPKRQPKTKETDHWLLRLSFGSFGAQNLPQKTKIWSPKRPQFFISFWTNLGIIFGFIWARVVGCVVSAHL